MKRTISYVLILLLLLNFWGMYGVFVGMQFRNDLKAHQQIDDGAYSREQLIAIKIPLTLPYAYETSGFDRVEGQFEHKGELYRLIEKKLSNDTLTIFCVRDQAHHRIAEVMADFVKTFSDQPTGQSSPREYTFIKDYIFATQTSLQSVSNCWSCPIVFSAASNGLAMMSYPVFTPPPERHI